MIFIITKNNISCKAKGLKVAELYKLLRLGWSVELQKQAG